jgi:hypothetical protein
MLERLGSEDVLIGALGAGGLLKLVSVNRISQAGLIMIYTWISTPRIPTGFGTVRLHQACSLSDGSRRLLAEPRNKLVTHVVNATPHGVNWGAARPGEV